MAAAQQAAENIDALSFEAALGELEEIVKKLESGTAPLEESIALYERGARLKARCEAALTAAREKIEAISLDADGAPKAEPASFD